jgi:NADH:ubiquinone oxidoreductase subunit 6 (subunit J)
MKLGGCLDIMNYKGAILLILVFIYTGIGMYFDHYFNRGHFEWSSYPIIWFWPIILIILGIMKMVNKLERRRR